MRAAKRPGDEAPRSMNKQITPPPGQPQQEPYMNNLPQFLDELLARRQVAITRRGL